FSKFLKKWSDGLDSGVLSCDDINFLKKIMEEKEMRILPTVKDLWVFLHQSFSLLCWCDDEKLKKEFKNLKNVDYLRLGDLTTEEKQMLQDKLKLKRICLLINGLWIQEPKHSENCCKLRSCSTKMSLRSLVFSLLNDSIQKHSIILKRDTDVKEGLKNQLDAAEGLIESDANQIIEENHALMIPSVILEEEQDIRDLPDSGIIKDSSKDKFDNGKSMVSAP
nr:histidine kinase-, DNA gyrase B-, and HSP90-like ATPase family protein [Tanacetum cinerariifolium]